MKKINKFSRKNDINKYSSKKKSLNEYMNTINKEKIKKNQIT